jgi:drug/metabolite transporter (DMT)-like permease
MWNAWLKITGDRIVALALMGTAYGVMALVAVPMLGVSPAPAARGYLAASALVHTAYPLTLIAAYRLGDLSIVYPVSRGTGPMLVTLVAAAFLGDPVGVTGFVAVSLIVAGIAGLGHASAVRAPGTIALSLVAGGLIASYTVLDGLGGRASPSAQSYVAWLFLLCGTLLIAVAVLARGPRTLWRLARPVWWQGLSAGFISALAYGIVIWAIRIAPMGLVAAARETSVAFAALIGGVWLHERVRWPAVLLVLAGIVLVRLSAEPA